MKLYVRVNWEDFVLEATPAEIDTLNKLLGRMKVIHTHDENPPAITTREGALQYAIRVLPDATTVNPRTEEN